jgi:hypothetical protein|tara:strand:+ start:201 stop:425 length:225 start_codon:yes stop_codon:yes gene_type:complete
MWTVDIVVSCFIVPPGDEEGFFLNTAMRFLCKQQFGRFRTGIIVFVITSLILYRIWQIFKKQPNSISYCSALSQ